MVPAQMKRNPYTSPAGPPLQLMSNVVLDMRL